MYKNLLKHSSHIQREILRLILLEILRSGEFDLVLSDFPNISSGSEGSENGDANSDSAVKPKAGLNCKGSDTEPGADSEMAADLPPNGSIGAAKDRSSPEVGLGSPPPLGPTGYLRCAGTLPGLGQYFSDSSDSENASSDTDSDERSRRPITRYRPQKKKHGGGCC